MTALVRSRIAGLAIVALTAMPAGTAAQTRSTRTNSPASIGIHGFSVVLIVGSLHSGGATPATTAATENVPETAKKALSDMKDFLPFKRYQLLDAAWMLCCAASSGVSGTVRGPDYRDYTYAVDPLGTADSKLNLRFSMRESSSEWYSRAASGGKTTTYGRADHARELAEAARERDDADAELKALKQKYTDSSPQVEAATVRSRRAAVRLEELQRSQTGTRMSTAPARNIMDSTFSIAAGETVVVGTSRLNGDQALIAILTAAAKPGATR
jgi:hypothetical protein